ncbi:hypothetical protein [Chryseobacterium flavum]|uniref:hypothetical protein n=1 Tax=Chryseobacterium flavum TaxID=415851 RepID=UPI0028A78981|nr:hypothetical protein [Chryseobacterium flavum]
MENIKNLFTDEDFKLLNQAIDALPSADISGLIMGEMLFMAIGKDEDKETRDRERDARFKEHEQKTWEMKEKCLELKFKILQLKKVVLNDTLTS